MKNGYFKFLLFKRSFITSSELKGLLLDTFIGIEILISNSKILLIISKISFLFVVYKIVFLL